MVYSKFFKHSNNFIRQSVKIGKFSHNKGFSLDLNSHVKVSWGASIHLNTCNFSTVFNSKTSNIHKPSLLKCAAPLNFTAFLSTNEIDEAYKIVITNPSEGTSTTLNSSLSSSNDITLTESLPAPSTELTDIATSLTGELSSVAEVIEPSLASLGLANWTPVGAVQMLLEYMHIGMHWPWWLSIVTTTILARIILFPVLIKTQKNAIMMGNYMPKIQFLQMKFGEARRTGNTVEATKYAHEMMSIMKDQKINPIKNAMFPLIQAPVFLSFFLALRGMAKAPVESMKEGGLSWVTDLTIPDPYYILPIIACTTLYGILKVGAESGVKMENLKMAKYLLQALPVICFPFCINFPSAVLYYWCSNNFCTLLFVSILKIKPVREYFNLPTRDPIDPKYIMPKKGFVKGVKEAFDDQKALSSLDERSRIDHIRFQKSGTGPIPRTYSYDPTKPRPSNVASAVAAKQRKP